MQEERPLIQEIFLSQRNKFIILQVFNNYNMTVEIQKTYTINRIGVLFEIKPNPQAMQVPSLESEFQNIGLAHTDLGRGGVTLAKAIDKDGKNKNFVGAIHCIPQDLPIIIEDLERKNWKRKN